MNLKSWRRRQRRMHILRTLKSAKNRELVDLVTHRDFAVSALAVKELIAGWNDRPLRVVENQLSRTRGEVLFFAKYGRKKL